jgi:hypothetical protein
MDYRRIRDRRQKTQEWLGDKLRMHNCADKTRMNDKIQTTIPDKSSGIQVVVQTPIIKLQILQAWRASDVMND